MGFGCDCGFGCVIWIFAPLRASGGGFRVWLWVLGARWLFVVSLLHLVGFGDFRWFTALDLAFCGVIAFRPVVFVFLRGWYNIVSGWVLRFWRSTGWVVDTSWVWVWVTVLLGCFGYF